MNRPAARTVTIIRRPQHTLGAQEMGVDPVVGEGDEEVHAARAFSLASWRSIWSSLVIARSYLASVMVFPFSRLASIAPLPSTKPEMVAGAFLADVATA